LRSAKILTGTPLLLAVVYFGLSCSSAAAYFPSINFGMMLRDAFAVGILRPEVLSHLRDYESELKKSDPNQKNALLGPFEPMRPDIWATCDDFRMISFNQFWEVDPPIGWNEMMDIPIWAVVSWETAYFSGRVTSFRASIGVADDRIVFEDVIDPESGLFTEAANQFLREVPGRFYGNILENGILFSQIHLADITECPGGIRIFNVEGN